MLMNGTEDPIVHYDGGETSLLGLFYKGGILKSSRESARFFANLNQIGDAPLISNEEKSNVERALWRSDRTSEGKKEV